LRSAIKSLNVGLTKILKVRDVCTDSSNHLDKIISLGVHIVEGNADEDVNLFPFFETRVSVPRGALRALTFPVRYPAGKD
jgi:hypothetical protein